MISPKENEACDEDGCDFINCCVACAKVEYDGEGNVTGGWGEGLTSLDEDDLDPSLCLSLVFRRYSLRLMTRR